MNLDVAKIVAAVGGRLIPSGGAAAIHGVTTDSRQVKPGNLFVALKGPNFDGHNFIATAASAGAAAALCEQAQPGVTIPQIVVEDSLRGLGNLAAAWRQRFAIPLIAVTGSSGKTTTKEMLAAILASRAAGIKTEGNLNNLIGLPLTLCRLEGGHQWAVLEMGMSERGEIARLTEIAHPSVAIITNVAPAHLATLRSLDGIARAKGELFAGLPSGGTAVVNGDDERVSGLPVANGVQRVLFGMTPGADVRAESVAADGNGFVFTLLTPAGSRRLRLPLPGRHNVANALAATTAALLLKYDLDVIAAALEAFQPVAGRMEVLHQGGVTILADTYNANPLSMQAALLALDEMGGGGRRIAVLADMLELGESSAQLHREVGATAARHCDLLITLGEGGRELALGAQEAGLPSGRVVVADDHNAAIEELRRVVRQGDRVVVKGSRGMKMERITAALLTLGKG